MLFKGRFLITVSAFVQELFENPEESLEDKMRLVVDKEQNVDIKKFISNSYFSLKLHKLYKDYDFMYYKALKVNPETMWVSNKNFKISFQMKSEEIEFLRIKGTEITFKNTQGKEITTTLNSEIEIINTESLPI